MPNPLAAHPPWRQLVIVSIVVPLVVVAAVLAYAWPAGRLAPRNVPVGVVGTSAAGQQLVENLDRAVPNGFDFRLYADDAQARAGIEGRDVYGAFDVTPGHLTVLQASAASPIVAQLLDTTGQRLASQANAAGTPTRVSTVDVVALSADDTRGTVFSSALLPLTICGMLVAAAIGVLVRFRPAWRQIQALVVVSAIVGAGTYLVAQTFLGALPHQGFADWASISLTVLAIGATTTGLVALIGTAGLGLAAALMVFVGNPFSGVTSAPEMLPDAVKDIGQWLPPGAGASLLRSTGYFDGNGATGHLAVLIVWAVLGIAAIVLGHHSPIRFAAQRGGYAGATAAAPMTDAPAGEHEAASDRTGIRLVGTAVGESAVGEPGADRPRHARTVQNSGRA